MKFYLFAWIALVIFFGFAASANASKADYCSVYAHDFADSHSPDRALWQHKYEIAMTDCLNESTPSTQVENGKMKVAIKTKKPDQKIASVTTKVVKSVQPTLDKTSAQNKLVPGSEAWNDYCTNKYASFNSKTGTYTSKTGVTRKCVVFYP